MATSKGKRGINRGVIAAAIVVVVTVAVIVVSFASRTSSRGDDEEEQIGPEDVRADEKRRTDELKRRISGEDKRSKTGKRRKGPRYVYPNRPAEAAMKAGLWNPPRPLRLVVSHGQRGGGRSEEEARQLADDARRRFLAGEDSYELIREVSDAPRGIPAELIKRYVNLRPDQASPVLPIKNGFALFFGTPTSPPERDGEAGPPTESEE